MKHKLQQTFLRVPTSQISAFLEQCINTFETITFSCSNDPTSYCDSDNAWAIEVIGNMKAIVEDLENGDILAYQSIMLPVEAEIEEKGDDK